MSRPVFLRCAAFAVLIIGLGIAVHVDRAAPAVVGDDSGIAGLAPEDSKRYGYEVGQVGGEMGLLMDGVEDRLERGVEWATTGRAFAVIIAIGSVTGAGMLLRAADRGHGGPGKK